MNKHTTIPSESRIRRTHYLPIMHPTLHGGQLMLSAGNQQVAVVARAQVDRVFEPKVFGEG